MDPPVLQELRAAWKRTDEIFGHLREDAWHERPIPLRHPPIFYLGHLPAFTWNQISRGVLGLEAFHPEFDELFERGIDPEDESEVSAFDSWPDVEQVVSYRDGIRESVIDLAAEVASRGGRDSLPDGLGTYAMVLEHEQMHHETLVYLLHELLPEKRRTAGEQSGPVPGDRLVHEKILIPAGKTTLGANPEDVEFCWDNEMPARRENVSEFLLDRYPVTISDFREFVDAGGYRSARYWNPHDWKWMSSRGVRHPHNWSYEDGVWYRRTFDSRADLDRVGRWPVLVTFAEALAYSRWKGARLPTEPELHRAAYGSPENDYRPYPWGSETPEAKHGNFDFARFDPSPVGASPEGRSAFGVDELIGNGWEWTSTPFSRFAGFDATLKNYPGYSADFFDGDHFVLFGGAWPTARRLLRRSFRNWFRRRYSWAFTTFRCAYSSRPDSSRSPSTGG